MFKSFFQSKQWAVWAWGGLLLIILFIFCDVYLSVKFNKWYKSFYDILQAPKDIALFWSALKYFLVIALISISIRVLAIYLANHYTLRWRQAMTHYYIPLWKMLDKEVEGSSQRIQEDTQKFARLVEELGAQLIRSLLTPFAFIPILWHLSEGIAISMLQFPGSLVTVALLMSIGGLIISWLVGIKLPGLEYNNQKVEATFRKQLVYGEDNKNYVDFNLLTEMFTGIRYNYSRLFLHYTYFNIWKNFYYQFNIILPYLLIAPSLFTGAITLGVIVQTGNAFGQVHEASSVLLDRWTQVTELRSVLKRLKEFEYAIT
ncbi:MAG: putative transporter [Endozoicomonadaceae bacterium]|nr:putative transporter [Endozoicomonadaceae bacterium]